MLGRGVRQGCSPSPGVFNINKEAMVKEMLSDLDEGMKMGRKLFKVIRFANEKAFVRSKEGLQRMIDEVVGGEQVFST